MKATDKIKTYAVTIKGPNNFSYEKLVGDTSKKEAMKYAEKSLLFDGQWVDSIRKCVKSDIGRFYKGCA